MVKEVQIWISPELRNSIKIKAARKGLTMKAFLEEKFMEGQNDRS